MTRRCVSVGAVAAGCGCILILASSGPARAQDASDLAKARAAFAQAMTDEKAGSYAQAAKEFDDARTLAQKETPQVLFHLGVCHSRLGQVVLARGELESAVTTAKAQGLDKVATTAQQELDQVRPRIAVVTVKKPARAATSMTLDRVESTAKLGAPIDVDPGAHDVHVAFADGPPADVHLTLAEGEHKDVTVPEPGAALAPAPAPAPAPASASAPALAPASAPASAPDATPSSGSSTLGWVLVGSGAALAIGGAVFWVLRGNEISKLDGDCGAGGQSCPASDQGDINSGKLDNTLGVSLFIAGGVAAAAGAGLLLFGGSHAPATTGVRVLPVVTASGGGVGVQGALW
jgi:hypothetical protein